MLSSILGPIDTRRSLMGWKLLAYMSILVCFFFLAAAVQSEALQ